LPARTLNGKNSWFLDSLRVLDSLIKTVIIIQLNVLV